MAFAFRRRHRAAADGEQAATGQRVADAGALAVGSLLALVRRLLVIVVLIVVGLIGLAIVFKLADANASNSIVSAVHDAGRWLVGPFDQMFKVKSAKATLTINWGIAAIVYLIVGMLIAGLIARMATATFATRTLARPARRGASSRSTTRPDA
jgi:hypothetical protein